MAAPHRSSVAATSRLGSLLRGAGALLLITLLLVGLPTVLIVVIGLPTSLPSAADLRLRLTSPDDGTVFVAAAATVGWAAWALFAAATVLEAVSLARHRGSRATAARKGAWGQGALSRPRWLAGQLLAAVLLLGDAGRASAPPSAPPPAFVAAALVPDRPPAPLAVEPGTGADAAPATSDKHSAAEQRRPAHGLDVEVRRGDTLWDLAERHLGGGEEWPKIARANYGRQQPDGRSLTDAHWIYPGWRLRVPTHTERDARPPANAQTPDRSSRADQPAAGYQPPAGRRFPAATSAGTATPSGTATQRGTVPPANPISAVPRTAAPGNNVAPSNPLGERQREILAASLAGAGLLAAGLALELRRRGRRQLRNRPSGCRVTQPGAEPARAEAAIRAAADFPAATALQVVLRSLAPTSADAGTGRPAARILALELFPTALTVRLAAPGPTPVGWAADEDHSWRLDAAGRARLLAHSPTAAVDPLPALVTVGVTPGGGYLLLNLAILGAVTVTGPDSDAVDRQLRTMALELATSPWGGPWFELATVGLPEVDCFDRAVPYPDLTAALAALRARVDDAETACRESGAADALTARARDGDDDRLLPIVLVSAQPAAPEQLAELAELTARMPGLAGALLPADDADAAAVVRFTDDGNLRVPLLDAEVRPTALAAAEITAIHALFATSATPPHPAAQDPGNLSPELDALPHLVPDPGPPELEEPTPADHETVSSPRLRVVDLGDRATGADPERPAPQVPVPPVLVRLLGPLDVSGSARPLTTSRGRELVLALALRGKAGVDGHRLADLLGAGGDTPVTAAYRQQIVSRVRAQLGPAGDGRPRILYESGVYRLHPEVGTDLQLFQAHTAAGSRPALRSALALVSGAALDGSDYWWLPDLAGAAQAEIRANVVDAAERLAALDLAAGDPNGAVAAAGTGLRVDPDERLYRALMRAHAAAGNLAGVARAWQECLAALRELDVPAPHPDTVAVYRQTGALPVAAAGRRG